MKALFLRALEEAADKGRALREAIRLPDQAPGQTRFSVDPARFTQVPRSPFAYWASNRARAIFAELPPFESAERTARVGLQTCDDFRFTRMATEVSSKARQAGQWRPFVRGVSGSPFYSDLSAVVKWGCSQPELEAFGESKGNAARSRQSSSFYFRPGLTWPARPHLRGAFALVPPGCIFSHTGTMLFEHDESRLLSTCAILNSAAFLGLLHLLMPRGTEEGGQTLKYEVGYVTSVPLPTLSGADHEALTAAGLRSWRLRQRLASTNEVSLAFHLPALLQAEGSRLAERAVNWGVHLMGAKAELAGIQTEIDDRCFELYGLDGADRMHLGHGLGGASRCLAGVEVDDTDDEASNAEAIESAPLMNSLQSWAVGVAFGRFDLRLATRERAASLDPEPFAALPVCSPGMLAGEDGLPLEEPPAEYPIAFPRDGILVDNPGHERDLVARSRQVFEEIFPDSAARWEEAAEILGEEDRTLRTWFSRRFFESHLRQYSKSRRRAPIYWPLSTASGFYTVWLYYPRLTADTLYQVVSDHLEPKLRQVQEERLRAEADQGRAQGRDAARLAKQAGELAALEQELEEMKAELLRVAQLPYKPDQNDGVQITAAPLWRLFRHAAWRKLLEDTWKKLEKGEYDWAHLAYAIWPERVREKCKSDRSLAIAHGLEHLFASASKEPKQGAHGKRASKG